MIKVDQAMLDKAVQLAKEGRWKLQLVLVDGTKISVKKLISLYLLNKIEDENKKTSDQPLF